MISRRSIIVVALLVVVAAALGLGAYRVTAQRSLDGGALTVAIGLVAALAGVAAAVATAYAALAALRAARESSVAAARATEALGLALEPSLLVGIQGPDAAGLVLEGPGTTIVRLRNTSRWAATDIVVHVEAADGRTANFPLAYLGPAPAEHSFPFEDRRAVPSDDPGWLGRVDLTDKLVTDYSDERHLLKWRMTKLDTLTLDYGPRMHSSGGNAKTEVERLS